MAVSAGCVPDDASPSIERINPFSDSAAAETLVEDFFCLSL